MGQRYEMPKEPDGLRSVIDVFTGQPATIEGVTVGQGIQETDDVLDLLNSRDIKEWKTERIA